MGLSPNNNNKKKRKKKKQSLGESLRTGLLPCKGDSSSEVARKLIFLGSLCLMIAALVIIAVHFISLLKHAPKVFWTVGLVQFFCWAAFMYMWTYTNGAIAQNVWGTGDTASAGYQEAGNWVGVLFAVQAIGSVCWALVLPLFRSRKGAYSLSLLLGGIGFISTFFVHNQYLLFISFALVGFAWAAMLAMPFTILTNSVSGKNMGAYLGLFNGTICVPQIVAALVGGSLLHAVGGKQIGMLVLAGVLLIIGAACVFIIKETYSHPTEGCEVAKTEN